jgi:hypothetical protein
MEAWTMNSLLDTKLVSYLGDLFPRLADDKQRVSICHHVYFFRSAAVAEAWLSERPGTRLLTLDEAWALGRKKNAIQFGAALNPPLAAESNRKQVADSRSCCVC